MCKKNLLLAVILSLSLHTAALAHDEAEEALLPPLPSASLGAIFKVEYHSYLPGRNLGLALPVADIGECLDACTKSRQCRAFTFVKIEQQPPLFDNPQPLCWLKDSVSAKQENMGMISGIKQ